MTDNPDAGAPTEPGLRAAAYQGPFRVLHLIDVENLVGRDIRTGTVKRALRTYGTEIRPDKRDTVVVAIAVTHRNILSTLTPQLRSDFRFFSVLGRAEADGADEALVNALKVMRLRAPLRRDYGQTVFASGDAYFVGSAKELANEGVSVVNVTGIGKRSTTWSVRVAVGHRQLSISPPTAGASPVIRAAQGESANRSHSHVTDPDPSVPAAGQRRAAAGSRPKAQAPSPPKGVPRVVLELRSHEKMLPAVTPREMGHLLSAVTAALGNWHDLGLDAADSHQKIARLGRRARKIAHDKGGSVAADHSNYLLAKLCAAQVLKAGVTYGEIREQFASYLVQRAADLGCLEDPEKDRRAVEEWLEPE